MIAKDVIFTSDGEGNNYYIPKDRGGDWDSLIDYYGRDGEGIDVPSWAVPVEGEVYVVDIKEKL